MKELSNESLRLSASYPGTNAQVISSHVEEVHYAWESLQAASSARKKKLRAASELQKFLSSVRTSMCACYNSIIIHVQVCCFSQECVILSHLLTPRLRTTYIIARVSYNRDKRSSNSSFLMHKYTLSHTHTCNNQVRDMVSWMHDMRAMLSTDEPARSVTDAEALQGRHNELKAEIDAREDSMAQINKAGRKLTQQGHYASMEVSTNTTNDCV